MPGLIQKIDEYSAIKNNYEDINSKFKKLSSLSLKEKQVLLKQISELDSFLSKNNKIGMNLEKEEGIVLYDQNGKYNGNRLKIMAYWIQREFMNSELIKLRDDNLATITLMIDPKYRKRQEKTIESIENLRQSQIEENGMNLKIRKFYLDIIDLYKDSIELAKLKNIKYSGMLLGMEDAEKFNNFLVGQIDLTLAAMISKETANIIYPYLNQIMINEKKISPQSVKEIEKLKNKLNEKINHFMSELEATKRDKEKAINVFKDIASGKVSPPIELVNQAVKTWKSALPEYNQKEKQLITEINGMNLALSALDRIQLAA